MKKILLTLLLLLPLGSLLADNTNGQLVIKQKDGKEHICYFSEHPTILFEGDQMRISLSRVALMFKFNEITGYYFKNVMTDIEQTESDNIISQLGETIIVNTGKAGDKVTVFDSAGAVVSTMVTDSHGKASVSLRSLPAGVFIVNCLNNSYKIIKQ